MGRYRIDLEKGRGVRVRREQKGKKLHGASLSALCVFLCWVSLGCLLGFAGARFIHGRAE